MQANEWHERRKNSIGGSDIAAIYNKSPYLTIYGLWQIKTGQKNPFKGNLYTQRGNEKEAEIRAAVSSFLSAELKEKVTLLDEDCDFLTHKDYPHMHANLDGWIECETYGKCVLEIKTVHPTQKFRWRNQGIPFHYLLQVMHYLAITGAAYAFVVALIGNDELIYRKIERDDELIEDMKHKVAQFWESVRMRIPPKMELSEKLEYHLSGTESTTKIVRPECIGRLYTSKSYHDDYKRREEDAKSELIRTLRYDESERYRSIEFTDGEMSVSVSAREANRLDIKALREAHPEIVKKFEKITKSYIFSKVKRVKKDV